LQQFFGNIRRAAGPNNHPNPRLFAQLHRLLSVYSLIQPPKNSNVSGVENLNALMSGEDLIAAAQEARKDMINEMLDEVIELGK
jgi:hypothetical protein